MGRFLAGEHSVVWIDWTGGGVEQRLVYRNGELTRVTDLCDDRLAFESGAELTLDRSCTLRSGQLGSTVLGCIPGVKRFAPARVLGMHETKWRSRGELRQAGEPNVNGWAIHEVVRWP